jgi:hypothetical protein
VKMMFYCHRNVSEGGGRIRTHVFVLPKMYSNYAIHMFLREMMEISHVHIIIKSKVGVVFDVPHGVIL